MHNQSQNQRNRRDHGNQRKPEDDNQSIILDLARVTRVQRGGKRLRFRVCVGLGDKKGSIGIGIAKSKDVATAVEKASRRAKRDMIKIPLTKAASIPHIIETHYKAAHLLLKPSPVGTGIKAGGVIRILCDLAGIENISAKILGTSNKISNAQALIQGMRQLRT